MQMCNLNEKSIENAVQMSSTVWDYYDTDLVTALLFAIVG